MPMQWNDQADARLFANVLKLHVSKLDYPALARSMGSGVTAKAISHRISKIKDKARAYGQANSWAFADGVDDYLNGPSLARPAHKNRSRNNNNSRGADKYSYYDNGSDDSDNEEAKEKRKVRIKLEAEEWRRKVVEGWKGVMEAESDDERPIWVWRSRGKSSAGGGGGDGGGDGKGSGEVEMEKACEGERMKGIVIEGKQNATTPVMIQDQDHQYPSAAIEVGAAPSIVYPKNMAPQHPPLPDQTAVQHAAHHFPIDPLLQQHQSPQPPSLFTDSTAHIHHSANSSHSI